MTTLACTFYDGRGSRGRPASLSRSSPGRLRVDCEGDVRDFAAGDLEITPRLGRMERIVRMHGGGQLHLADSPVLDVWLPRRDRIEAFAHWLEGLRAAALAAAILTVAGVVLFFHSGLPWMAEKAAPLVPRAMEKTIGDQALVVLDELYMAPSQLSPERQATLQQRFAMLVAGLPRAGDYALGFRHSPAIGANAFALPGGQIIMTDQLVALAENDEELLAILAHEAGHHEHRHGMRTALETSGVVVVAGFLFGDVSGAGSLSVSVPAVLLEKGFSRSHEREADDFAFERLRQIGVSPAHFAAIMERLEQTYGDGSEHDGPGSYMSTHPPSHERIETARTAAEGMPPVAMMPDEPADSGRPVYEKENP